MGSEHTAFEAVLQTNMLWHNVNIQLTEAAAHITP
jgi:hypothetical protein